MFVKTFIKGSGGSGGSGTVTSVGLSDSTGIFAVTGTPVTVSGSLNLSALNSQNANTFLAAPNGSSGAPSFRSVVSADIPTLPILTSAGVIFGTGADGTVSISSGVTSILRDMHYSNLTISGTGQILTNDFRIFVYNTLDLSSAGTNAIFGSYSIQTNQMGNNATNQTGATAVGGVQGGTNTTIPRAVNAGAGATATLASGTSGTSGTTSTNGVGGVAGLPGAGGFALAGATTGGTQNTGAGSTGIGMYSTPTLFFSTGNPNLSIPGASCSGNGGSAGAGDGTNLGGGGGGGGCGGQSVTIYARIIQRGSNTTASLISSAGGNGGNGGNASATGNAGGGGGGGAGGGGFIYILVGQRLGSVITSALDVSGGTGGTGGTGSGTGRGGNGANGGFVGSCQIIDLSVPSFTANNTGTAGTAGTAATTTAGGAGGAGAPLKVNL